MTTTPTSVTHVRPPTDGADRLHRLYLARSAFALVWAALLAVTASALGTAALVLLVLYPAVDVAAAVVDARTTARPGSPRAALAANVALSAAAAAALAVVGDDPQRVLQVWGAWAVAAGVVQLVVGVLRRAMPGQVPMILSGGLSVLAGAAFAASARQADSVIGLAGYAVLGGVFFLVSALRLRRGSSAPATGV